MVTMQSERLVAAARDVLKTQGYFVDNLWHIKDINLLCEQMGTPLLPPDEAMMVFELANQQFDGEYGINWPQLERALMSYLNMREAIKGKISAPETENFETLLYASSSTSLKESS